MRFKAAVRIRDLKPQTVLALGLCDDLYQQYGVEMVVTSCNDSRHSLRSKHYEGRAFDLRTKTIAATTRGNLIEAIGAKLRPLGFDVVFESRGRPNEHLHVEYDPR